MVKEVIKVQKPIAQSKEATNQPMWLIYDINRSRMQRLPESVVPKHVKEKMRDVNKAFFLGTYSSIVGWAISETVVVDPGW